MKTQFFVLSLHCCKLLMSSRIFSSLFTESFESCFKTRGSFPKSEDILDEEKVFKKQSFEGICFQKVVKKKNLEII